MAENKLLRKHGRKTAADRATMERVLAEMGLPAAPAHLPAAERAEWEEIVATYPPDRFPRATWPMLEGYCRHAVQARRIGKMIDELRPLAGDSPHQYIREYSTLLKMFTEQTKTVAIFGVRLGIARTSMAGRHNNDPDDIRNSAADPAPWADPH
jgi:hypothetical protein